MKQSFVIYGLICPIKKSIVYVGMTSDIEKRIKCHAHAGGNRLSKVGKYLLELKASGSLKQIKFVILESGIESKESRTAERKWIAHLSKSHELLNGNGFPKDVAGFIISIEAYNKLSKKKVKSI